MTYKIIVALVVLFIFVPFSCKKGEEDPILSLLTRKSRLSGEWILSTMNISGNSGSSDYSKVGDMNEITTVSTNEFVSSLTVETIKTYDLTINKDGTWEKIIDSDIYTKEVSETTPFTTETEATKTLKEIGTWAFVGATKGEYKNKERVIFNLTERRLEFGAGTHTESYTDGSGSTTESETNASVYSFTKAPGEFQAVYDLVMLKSKEMKWSLVSSTSEMNAEYDANGDIIMENNYDYDRTETIVWVSK